MTDLLDYDGDGDITMYDIYELILDAMNLEAKKKINGSDKKDNTMKTIQGFIPEDLYDRFEPMIISAIDFIYTLGQNTKLLKHIKKNCKCLA